jgi:hypothetical protein
MPRQTKPKAKVTANEKVLANLVAMKMTAKQPEMVAWMVKLVEAYPTLRYVKVTFHGGGDSGDIDEYELEDSEGAAIDSTLNNLPVGSLTSVTLAPDKDEFLYKFLDQHVQCDWVNNDGGGGILTFDLETGEVEVTSYYYETVETECDDVTVNLLD